MATVGQVEQLWRKRDLDAAFAAAVDLQLDEPHVDHGDLLHAIADDAAGAKFLLDRRPLFKALDAAMARTMGLLHLRAAERATFTTWAQLSTRVFSLHAHLSKGGWTSALGLVAAGFQRRAGNFEEALRLGRIVTATAPQTGAATQEGLALRALGRFDESAALFMRVFDETDDATFLCEAARARFDQGRFSEALSLFTDQRVRADEETALAAAACRRKLGVAGATEAELDDDERFALFFGDGGDARDTNGDDAFLPSYDDLRHTVLRDDGTYLWMGDATANVFAQLKNVDGKSLRMHVTHLECPSVVAAYALATRGDALVDDDVGYAFTASERKDAVHPAARVHPEGAELWDVRGRLPAQLLDPPPAATMKRLAPFADPAAVALAMPALVARVKQAQLHDVDPRELMSALIHPPPCDDVGELAFHVFAWQRAIALALALQKPQQPWASSQRRASLRALVLGPSDWTTAAALIALTEVLLDDLAALDDARVWIDILLAYAPRIEGHCPWATALEHLTKRVALFRKDLLAPLAGWLTASDDDDDGDAT